MTLLTLDDISLDIGDQPILRHASLTLEPNERVCLIGRNGAGKSTLQRIIMGEQQVDAGDIRYRQNLRITRLEQALPEMLDMSVTQYVASGLAHLQGLIAEYEARAQGEMDKAGLRELEDLQRQIDGVNARLARVQAVKKFKVIPREFSVEGGELTPTMKVRRKVVVEKYKEEIDQLYS